MTTHPATPDQSNPVGKTPEMVEALISELEYAILGAQFAGNFDRIRAAKDALRAALNAAAPAVAPTGHIWHLKRGQLRGLIAELQVQADAHDGDPTEADETELCLSFSPAGTVHDDERGLNESPLLTLWEAEYPEEGVYPIDPSGCAALAARQPSHPTRNMDSTAGVPDADLTAPAPWRSAVLDLIDDCPGLSMEQDQWLSRRVKELDFPSAARPQAGAESYPPMDVLAASPTTKD